MGSSRFSGVTCGINGDLAPAFNPRLDGLRCTVGDSGDRLGDAGRLLNESTVGIGVLDGRGATSMGRMGNALIGTMGEWWSWRMGERSGPCECLLDPVVVGLTEDDAADELEGMEIFSPSISSSSSIDGKL